MASISITKQNFMSLLDQFDGDPVFQHQIIERLFSKMPLNYRNEWITQHYFEHVCPTPYYKLVHVTYPDMVYYYTLVNDIIDRLQIYNFNNRKLNVSVINAHVAKGTPLCGFTILKKEGNKQ